MSTAKALAQELREKVYPGRCVQVDLQQSHAHGGWQWRVTIDRSYAAKARYRQDAEDDLRRTFGIERGKAT